MQQLTRDHFRIRQPGKPAHGSARPCPPNSLNGPKADGYKLYRRIRTSAGRVLITALLALVMALEMRCSQNRRRAILCLFLFERLFQTFDLLLQSLYVRFGGLPNDAKLGLH